MLIRSMLAVLTAAVVGGAAQAQDGAKDYPNRPIRLDCRFRRRRHRRSRRAAAWRPHHARDLPAGRGREPLRRRRHGRGAGGRQGARGRLHARRRALRAACDQSVRAEGVSARRAQGSSAGGGDRRGAADDRHQRRRSGEDAEGVRRARQSQARHHELCVGGLRLAAASVGGRIPAPGRRQPRARAVQGQPAGDHRPARGTGAAAVELDRRAARRFRSRQDQAAAGRGQESIAVYRRTCRPRPKPAFPTT